MVLVAQSYSLSYQSYCLLFLLQLEMVHHIVQHPGRGGASQLHLAQGFFNLSQTIQKQSELSGNDVTYYEVFLFTEISTITWSCNIPNQFMSC